MGRSGDGFVRCSDGRARWGVYGAAGVVFVVREPADTVVMMQRRSPFSHEGGTWSCAGGAIDEGEDPYEAAMREAEEEIGWPPKSCRLIGQYVFAPATDWTYTTVVVEVDHRFGDSLNFETDAVDWFTPDQVEQLPVHNGFAAAWPHLRAIITSPPSGTD